MGAHGPENPAMTRLLIGITTALLLSLPTSASAGELDAEAVKTARAFLAGLAGDIKAATAGEEGGRESLLKRGRLKVELGREIDRLVELTRAAGGLEGVRFNTFEVIATVWFGVVPLKEVELHMILSPDKMRLLRTVARDTRHRVFGRPKAVKWTGDGATAFGKLADQMVRAMTDGACETLPRIGPKDRKDFMPAKRKARKHTRSVLDRFDKMIERQCEALDKMPNHVITWQFGELGGSVATDGEKPVPFKLSLTPDAEGAPQIFHLRGIPPRKP